MSRKKYEEEAREKLKELEAEVDRLREHIKEAEQALEPKHHEGMEKLIELHTQVKDVFHEMLDAGDDAFESAQSRMEQYWSSLGREIKAYDQTLKDHL